MKSKRYTLKILKGSPNNQSWEEFELEISPFENVISALMKIRMDPVNKQGNHVNPIAWEDGCLEEVCGSCSMLINGIPKQACVSLISKLIEESGSNIITLAPLSKFPLIRDLKVDRSAMFENLKKVMAWIAPETNSGPGPKVYPKEQSIMYALSKCMTCGCCSESCPNVNEKTSFMGPAPIAQVRIFNTHPSGSNLKEERLHKLMEEGGLEGCGNAQNCVRVCPKGLPLVESIAVMNRALTKEMFRSFLTFGKD